MLPAETASAAGLSNFMRTTTAAFAASLSTTFWENSTERARDNLVGVLNNAEAAIDALVAQGVSGDQALRQLDAMVQMQSVMLATDRAFTVTALIFLLSAGFIWLAPRPRSASGSTAAH